MPGAEREAGGGGDSKAGGKKVGDKKAGAPRVVLVVDSLRFYEPGSAPFPGVDELVLTDSSCITLAPPGFEFSQWRNGSRVYLRRPAMRG